MVMHDRVKLWGESKTAERQRERVCVCVRDRALLETKDGMGNKFDHWRKYLWQMWEDNPRQSRLPLMIVFPGLEYFLS